MTCNHYEGSGLSKHFKIDDTLKCKMCHKSLTKEDVAKLKALRGKR